VKLEGEQVVVGDFGGEGILPRDELEALVQGWIDHWQLDTGVADPAPPGR